MKTVDELLSGMETSDQAKRYAAANELKLKALRATGKDREEIAKTLAASLTAKGEANRASKKQQPAGLSRTTKVAAIRLLGAVGGDAEVETLKNLLTDLDLREEVRWALDRITGAPAADAIAGAATNSIGPDFRVGAINALGRRGASAAALKECLTDPSPQVRLAAAEALANIPDPSLDAVLVGALKAASQSSTTPEPVQRLTRARIRLAGTLTLAGQKDAARKIYEGVLAANPDPAQRKACEESLKTLQVAAR